MTYVAPLREFQFVLNDVLNVGALSETELYAETSPDIIAAVLEEAAKYSEQVLAPLNRSGDEAGCVFDAGTVRTPAGFVEAYRLFQEAGWAGLNLSPEFGGQGLANTLFACVNEIMSTANPSFAMYRGLIEGAYNTLLKFGTEELQNRYLPHIASGAMLPTMNLTEPHCGSDLGLIRTKAVPLEDGTYAVNGSKIFITGGDHDLTKNIPHLVLAKLPDAPAGSKGISLFLVPKYYQDGDGQEVRNAVFCAGIEHKMGLKASATCAMNYDGAKGWLVGKPHAGLAAMFTMMNAARLVVAAQGICAMEGALQIAEPYAKERKQGKTPLSKGQGPDTIIEHPDVQRMLRTMKAFLQGGRSMLLRASIAHDLSHAARDPAERTKYDDHVQLMTPVLKAFLTDAGSEVANLGIQVLGGHGYIREWGIEQWVRDVRIAAIYEGTNGIQAGDLIGRKIALKDGALPLAFFDEVETDLNKAAEVFPKAKKGLSALRVLREKTAALRVASATEKADAASDYLQLFGYVALSREWASIASVAISKRQSDLEFFEDKVATAAFYFDRLLPRYLAHAAAFESCLTPADEKRSTDAQTYELVE